MTTTGLWSVGVWVFPPTEVPGPVPQRDAGVPDTRVQGLGGCRTRAVASLAWGVAGAAGAWPGLATLGAASSLALVLTQQVQVKSHLPLRPSSGSPAAAWRSARVLGSPPPPAPPFPFVKEGELWGKLAHKL